ncbi:MAG: hypothetical protein ACLTYN_12405 [Dysosmobacter welbionis]
MERPGPAGPFVCAANLFHSDLAVPLPPGLDSWRAAERYDTMRRVLEREGRRWLFPTSRPYWRGERAFYASMTGLRDGTPSGPRPAT